MKFRLPLFLLLGITSVALSKLSELSAQASTGQQPPQFRTDTLNSDKILPATAYFLPQQSALKIESQRETLVVPNPRLSIDIPNEAKVIVTPAVQASLAEVLHKVPQSSIAQNTHAHTIAAETSSIVSEPYKTGNDIPTVAEAKLPPIATTHNSAVLLKQTKAINQPDQATLAQTSEEEQFPPAEEVVPDEVDPGRPTRSGSSYIGVGANFGVGGDTSLGDSGLFLYSKIGLTRYFSVRPAVNTDFEEDATFLLPLTFDLAPIEVGDTGVSFAPYFGGGPAVSTTGDFGPVISGGVDLPLTEDLTVTSGVNIGILDEVDVGVFVGIGYNFSGF